MLANTILITALVSSAAVTAIPSSFKRDQADFEKCRNDCFNNIDAVAACTKNADPTACACNVDPSNDVKSLKCTFDCLDQVGSRNPFAYFRLNAIAAGVQNSNTTMCDSASSPPSKSGTLAGQFTLPSCASGCMTADNIPKCKDTLTDPKCVCGSIDNIANPEVSAFSVTKCVLDTCNEQDAAVSIIQLGVDCGDWTPGLNASQFQYPLNKLKKTFDANLPSGNASSSGGATTPSSTAASTAASPTDSPKKNGASGLTVGSFSFALGMLVLSCMLL